MGKHYRAGGMRFLLSSHRDNDGMIVINYHAIVHQQIFLQDLDTAIPRE